MNQSFNSRQLIKLCKQVEYIRYGMNEEQLQSNLETSYLAISNEIFEFNIKKVSEYYLTSDLTNKLVLRKLNDNIKRIYKDEQSNRKIIISQVKTLLEETCPFWVVKTDIRSFYESINREKLISKFQDDSMLSYQSMHLLYKLFNNPILSSTNGLPRGMNISATLSEIYMRKFDKWISRFPSVYYYARFVDDIIVFSNSLQSSLKLIHDLNEELTELAEGLLINEDKTELFSGNNISLLNKGNGKLLDSNKSLEYLGYSFSKVQEQSAFLNKKKFSIVSNLRYTFISGANANIPSDISNLEFDIKQDVKERKLKIKIASKKISKMKTRVVLAFLDFSKNRDFILLEKRVQFLTGNYSIRKMNEGNDLRAGSYYNYTHINDLSVFDELNTFYRKVIFSKKTKFGGKLHLSPEQKKILCKYCFRAGFLKKIYNSFTFSEMEDIIKCW